MEIHFRFIELDDGATKVEYRNRDYEGWGHLTTEDTIEDAIDVCGDEIIGQWENR
jgi:hypothetical protein